MSATGGTPLTVDEKLDLILEFVEEHKNLKDILEDIYERLGDLYDSGDGFGLDS